MVPNFFYLAHSAKFYSPKKTVLISDSVHTTGSKAEVCTTTLAFHRLLSTSIYNFLVVPCTSAYYYC